MKRKANYLVLLLVFCCMPLTYIWGQNPILRSTTTTAPVISGVTGSIITQKTEFVGIGTTNPTKRLTISGYLDLNTIVSPVIRFEYNNFSLPATIRNWELSANQNDFNLRYDNTGITPIRVANNGVVTFMDAVNLNVQPVSGDNKLGFNAITNSRQIFWSSYTTSNNTSIPLEFVYDAQGGTMTDVSVMKLMPSGQVRIGNINTTYQNFVLGSAPNTNSSIRLMVDGNIAAKGFIATQQNWADFVFYAPQGNPTLQQEEASIQENCTLVGVPTEAEAAQGRSLADNDALLLQKLEQLYLHVIELNKKVDALQLENEQLKAGINQK